MSKSTWTGAVSSDWADPDNWSPSGVPGVNSDVVIASGTPLAVASAPIGTVNSITDSSYLSFKSAGTNTVATFLDDTGHLYVEGGTILNIAAALTNSGYLSIGNPTLAAPDEVTAASLDNTGKIYLTGSGADQALLDVSGSAGFGTAGVLSGYARLAGDSAIEFKSGEITSLAGGAHLGLVGSDAFIEDSNATGSNSALDGLASIGQGALFALHDGASVSTSGPLVNDGLVALDPNSGEGGSSLTPAGALTNNVEIEIGNAALSASDTVTAVSLDNTGMIHLTGSSANQALLDVTGGSAGFGVAGILSGAVVLAGDSAIEFASGLITSLAAHAYLHLNGNDAFVEDSTALGSNSALTGFASIGAGARLDLQNGAAVSTTGALVNDGTVVLDGGNLTVAGTLTNTGGLTIQGVCMVGTLSNSGSIFGDGGTLNVTSGVAGFGTAGTVTGSVDEDFGTVEFASGQINTIAASSELVLGGNSAFIEDGAALGSNSALTGLADVAGSLYLDRGANVSTTGSLNDSGAIRLDWSHDDFGGSRLAVGGTLTNSGTLVIGGNGLSSSDSVTANSFVNSGTVELAGHGASLAALDVSGATTNNGSISISTNTEEFAGAVGGKGSFSLYHADLQFDSSVSTGQTINESSGGHLTLNEAQSFAATISGFGTSDTIDARNFLKTGTTFNFHENSAMTGGTLTLTDGSLTADILMTGNYSNSSFTLVPDSGTGTLVQYVYTGGSQAG